MELSDVVQGKEVRYGGGTLYVIEHTLPEIPVKKLASAIERGHPYLTAENLANTFPKCVPYSSKVEGVSPKRLAEGNLFIDIETRGLAHRHPLFLISMGSYTKDGMKVTALFARDYSEEHPLLGYFLEILHSSTAQVTFNGKTFDLPHIGRRSQHQGLMINGYRYRELAEVLEKSHVDLRDFNEGKLQDIEKLRFGYARKGDIPGSVIPGIYDNYVYGRGNQEKVVKNVAGIILHNIIDVVSLGALFADMCRKTGEAQAKEHKLAA